MTKDVRYWWDKLNDYVDNLYAEGYDRYIDEEILIALCGPPLNEPVKIEQTWDDIPQTTYTRLGRKFYYFGRYQHTSRYYRSLPNQDYSPRPDDRTYLDAIVLYDLGAESIIKWAAGNPMMVESKWLIKEAETVEVADYYIFYILMEECGMFSVEVPTGVGVTSEEEAKKWCREGTTHRSYKKIKVNIKAEE